MLAHEPVEWRAYLCITEIEFGDIDLGLGRSNLGFRLFCLIIPIVDDHLRGGAFLL